MRIQKYLSDQGVCSRREAEAFIRRGLVKLNGKVITEMGVQIDPAKDKVELLPGAANETAQKTTVIFNKPRGIVSSRITREGKTVYQVLPQFAKLDVIGRLDKESEGLLLLSSDGVIARTVTGDKHEIEKEYVVRLQEETNAGRLKKLEGGIDLDDGPTLPCKTHFVDKHTFRITLREGRKHQIRRMCEYLHLTVRQLKRLRIGPIKLGRLQSGEFRVLSETEIASLKSPRRTFDA